MNKYRISGKNKFISFLFIFILISLIESIIIPNIFNGDTDEFVQKNQINIINQNVPSSSQHSNETITLYFFYASQCPSCQAPLEVVNNFIALNPDLDFIYVDLSGNQANYTFAKEFFSNEEYVPYPSVVFVNGTCKYYLSKEYIQLDTLNSVYKGLQNNPNFCSGWTYHEEFNLLYSFFVGMISGLSPCIILIAGVFGANIFANQKNKFFIFNLLGFLAGVFLAYIVIGIFFYFTLDIALLFFNGLILKLIFGIPLMILGLWYIIDSFNENSRLFNTPDKLKNIFKKFAGKGTFISAFLLGLFFTILKSPCVAGILLSLLFSIKTSLFGLPTTIFAFLFFALGIATPIIIVFLLLKLGVNNDKINEKRKKIRPILRIISGLIIILTTLLSFF